MRKLLSIVSFLIASSAAFAQGAHDFKLNEVFVFTPACCQGDSAKTCQQQASYVDEYGKPASWIEIENISYSTHDIRNCFLTINPAVLDKTMSAPEREKLMSPIPVGDPRTSLSAKQRITFFADGKTNRGTLHLNFTLPVNKPFTVYLFDGNAVDLLDSVRVEALPAGSSYARLTDDEWQVCEADKVTPNAPNVQYSNDKIKEFKEKDPHGIAMTLMCMGVVFSCLILLFVFFHIFGTKGIDMETYTAVIGLALHEYFGGTHDLESGILTINQTQTTWADKSHELRVTPQHHQAN